MSEAIGKNWHGPRAVPNLDSFKRGLIRLKTFAEMLEQIELLFSDKIQHERLAACDPLLDVPPLFHGDRHHRRFKAGLHDPTGQHPRSALTRTNRQDKDAARYST